MKSYFTLLFLFALPFLGMAQVYNTVKGKIVNSETLGAMESVNIVNLNQVIGTTTSTEGDSSKFEQKPTTPYTCPIWAIKSIKVKGNVTTGSRYGTSTTIELTELALALEEVNVNKLKLTGYLEVDIKQVPIRKNTYATVFLGSTVDMNQGQRSPSMVTKRFRSYL